MLVYVHELSNMNLIECRLPDADKQVNNKYETVNKTARQHLCGWDVRPLLAARVTAFFLLTFICFFNVSFIGLSRSNAATSARRVLKLKLPPYVRQA